MQLVRGIPDRGVCVYITGRLGFSPLNLSLPVTLCLMCVKRPLTPNPVARRVRPRLYYNHPTAEDEPCPHEIGQFSLIAHHAEGHRRFLLMLFAGSLLPTLSPNINLLVLSEDICEQYDILPHSFHCANCGMFFISCHRDLSYQRVRFSV